MSFIPKIGALRSGVDFNRARALTGLWNDYRQYQEQGAPVQPPASEQPAPVPHTRQIVNPSGGSLAYLLRNQLLTGAGNGPRTAFVGHRHAGKAPRQIPRLLSPQQAAVEIPVRIDWQKEWRHAAAANSAISAHINARLRTLDWLARTMEPPVK